MTCVLSLMGLRAAKRNCTLLLYLEDVHGLPLLSTTTARHRNTSSPFIGESSSIGTPQSHRGHAGYTFAEPLLQG